MQKIDLLGMSLTDYTLKEAQRIAERYLQGGVCNSIVFLSAKMLVGAGVKRTQKEWLEDVDLIAWSDAEILKKAGVTSKARIHDVENREFLKSYLKTLAKSGQTIYLLSDSESELEQFRQDLFHLRGDLRIIGEMVVEEDVTDYDAVVNAGRLMKEGRAGAVKLEGGVEVCPQIKAITDAGIPVCAHLGLTPQSINAFGGFKVQGKTEAAAKKLLSDAKAVEEAGAFAVVLECVPAKLAELVTKEVGIPTIGIGAGNVCDGQVLVYQDMLGMFSDFTPKFVKRFENIGEIMKNAFVAYDAEVKAGSFPAKEHEYTISDDVLDKLY